MMKKFPRKKNNSKKKKTNESDNEIKDEEVEQEVLPGKTPVKENFVTKPHENDVSLSLQQRVSLNNLIICNIIVLFTTSCFTVFFALF